MKKRLPLKVAALLAFIAALMATTIVSAGGWVVITLDKLPEAVTAGQPYTLGLMARQHGRTPWQVDELPIEARQAGTGKVLTFTALPEGQPGHYQAELLFPEPGRWEWGVASGLYPDLQPMPALEVAGAAQSAAAGSGETKSGILPVSAPVAAVGGLAVLAFAAGVVLIARSRARRLPTLAGIGMLAVCGALVFGLFSTVNAQAKQAQAAAENAISETSTKAVGQQLFLAKGCVVCHVNNRAIENSATYGVSFGPNLTAYRNDPEYLHTLLKDPQAVKAGSEMPNLELKRTEIEALIDFINDQE